MEAELGAVVAAQIQDSLPFSFLLGSLLRRRLIWQAFFPFQVTRIIARNFISFMVSANGFCAGSFFPLEHLTLLRSTWRRLLLSAYVTGDVRGCRGGEKFPWRVHKKTEWFSTTSQGWQPKFWDPALNFFSFETWNRRQETLGNETKPLEYDL